MEELGAFLESFTARPDIAAHLPSARRELALRALADRIEREHPDDVMPEVERVIAMLQKWRDDNGYVTPERLK